jgi:hypothetical protein
LARRQPAVAYAKWPAPEYDMETAPLVQACPAYRHVAVPSLGSEQQTAPTILAIPH